MEGTLTKLLLFAAIFIIKDVTHLSETRGYILIAQREMSWSEARSYCQHKYTDLATIPTDEDLSVIAELGENMAFWIGLYDDINSWEWSLLGKPLSSEGDKEYRKWQKGQPDNAGAAERCVSMTRNGTWRDDSCTAVQMFPLCYTKNSREDPYVLVTIEMSWQDAQSYCRRFFTDLASVMSLSENIDLMEILQRNSSVQAAWIGLHRASWKWADSSSSSYRRWSSQQPDNENGSQSCVYMHRGSWNDWDCADKLAFLCEEIIEENSEPTFSLASGQKTVVNVTLLTNANLTDRTIRHRLLQQLEAAFARQVSAEVRLFWITQPQRVQQSQQQGTGSCEDEETV